MSEYNFTTVGELRKMLDGLPDDRFIACQVVATDGTAWNMRGEFVGQVPDGHIAVITFRHDQLETLPNPNDKKEHEKFENVIGKCIYCGLGPTERMPFLYRVHAPGEYWQHWSYEEERGCEENKGNFSPFGEKK